jgi:hypothetical protein
VELKNQQPTLGFHGKGDKHHKQLYICMNEATSAAMPCKNSALNRVLENKMKLFTPFSIAI